MNAPFLTLSEQCPTFTSPWTLGALVVGLLAGCAIGYLICRAEEQAAWAEQQDRHGMIG